MPRPQAVPSTRTTLRPAARTWGSRAVRPLGGATFGAGPAVCGDGGEQERAGERKQRRVRRMRPIAEDERSEPRADVGASDETGERQGAHDQTLGITPYAHERRERDDDPVDGRHRHRTLEMRTRG